MQTIKIKSIETKSGEKDGKPWTKYTIHGEDGSSVATFAPEAATLKEGESIEADIVINGKYTNLKSFKVTEPAESKPEPEKAITGPQHPNAPLTPSNKDKEIAEAVAIKAVVELAVGKVLEPTHPLVTAVKSWCCDKLTHYLPLSSVDAPVVPKTAEKATALKIDGKKEDTTIDRQMLLNSIKHRMKYTGDSAALKWLQDVNKIPQERIDNEPDAVYAEIKEKYKWS